ncbi:hypothetical protein CEXT_84281 [Caerostris extrusa]|uniref:Uncharacterized protein n=1 Tax=Caerostris extrusa TaxID=172846 RepID=A0AAV4RA76_CAEEX|nr:hypothetical protein CEXT_84281 [Caerostris extrusa]
MRRTGANAPIPQRNQNNLSSIKPNAPSVQKKQNAIINPRKNKMFPGLSHLYAEFQTIPPTPTLLRAEQTIKRRPPLELKMHRLANLRSSSLNCS